MKIAQGVFSSGTLLMIVKNTATDRWLQGVAPVPQVTLTFNGLVWRS